MNAVRINDLQPERNALAVDLADVLDALGQRVETSFWRVRDVWAIGESSFAMEALTAADPIDGAGLKQLAERAHQVVDGVFSGFDPGAAEPWVVVQAIDSSFYTVHSDDDEVLGIIRRTFRDVTAHPDPVLPPWR